jgi:hypothetical protein
VKSPRPSVGAAAGGVSVGEGVEDGTLGCAEGEGTDGCPTAGPHAARATSMRSEMVKTSFSRDILSS